MAVYVECPSCHRKQALKNDKCRACEFDIQSARRKNKAACWVYIRYRGRQIWERIGPVLTVAREQEKTIRVLEMANKISKPFGKDANQYANNGYYKQKDITTARIEMYKESRLQEGAKFNHKP